MQSNHWTALTRGALRMTAMRRSMAIAFLASMDKGTCFAIVPDKKENHSHFIEEEGWREELELEARVGGGACPLCTVERAACGPYALVD